MALLTLLAMLIAQAAAGLHMLTHLGPGDDTTGPPATHVQACLDCGSFAPLAAAVGGAVTALFLATLGAQALSPAFDQPRAQRLRRVAFRSRAPPR